MQNKADLRIYARIKRKSFDTKTLSSIIASKILQLPQFQKAENILCFFPKKYEVNLSYLFINKSKNYYLPKVNGNILELYRYVSKDRLLKSEFGVYEPAVGSRVNVDAMDLIIVPAMMVDEKGFRLGYGKGFYDRLLSNTKSSSVAVVFDELLVKDLPKDDFDKSCNIIVTENRILFI